VFCYPSLLSHVLLSLPPLPCFAIPSSSPMFCYPSLLSRVFLSLPQLPCFAIPPSSPVFCYPSLLSHVLLSLPYLRCFANLDMYMLYGCELIDTENISLPSQNMMFVGE
jgi:hypothetical protein